MMDWIDIVTRDLCEIPDRSSPDGQPEMLLVTAEEIRRAIENNLPERPLEYENKILRDAIALAYGHLWHVNAGMGAPSEVAPPSLTPEKAAYEARKVLRDLITKEARGEAINSVRQLLTPNA